MRKLEGQASPWSTEVSQLTAPYHSTVALIDFLQRHECLGAGARILDAGCGLGAFLFYLKKVHPELTLSGIDYNARKIDGALAFGREHGMTDINFTVGDWLKLSEGMVGAYDGVIAIHTLCCFKDVEAALWPLIRLRPRWIALNSLFYDGPLDVLIHIRSHLHPEIKDDDPDGDFNIHSLQRASAVLATHGYATSWEPFYPPEEIARPADGRRGTYTMPTALHPRTQFSGPVHLPWHFLMARRKA